MKEKDKELFESLIERRRQYMVANRVFNAKISIYCPLCKIYNAGCIKCPAYENRICYSYMNLKNNINESMKDMFIFFDNEINRLRELENE